MKRCALILVLLTWASASFAVWPPAQRITTGPSNNLNPTLSCYAGTQLDTACLVWQRSRTSGWDIYYSTNPTGAVWTTPQVLTNQADSNLTPVIAGGTSRWVCAWVNVHGGIQDIAFSRWQAGAWTAPFAITTDGFDDADPTVWIADLHDTIWVAWSSFRSGRWSIISRVYNGSSWSPEISVVTSPGNNRKPRLFLSYTPHVPSIVWQGDANGNWDIYLSRFQGGIWTPPVTVTSGLQADLSPAPVPFLVPNNNFCSSLLWATDSLGNYEIFETSIDSLTARERITSSDSSDIEPVGLNHRLPSEKDVLYPPILTAWTSRRDGNSNIYAELFRTQGVVDTNRANDNHPVVTSFSRSGYAFEWVVWQSNRDGNWNLFGSYQLKSVGIEAEDEKGPSGLYDKTNLTPSPFHPPGALALYLTDPRTSVSLKFYDPLGRCVEMGSAEKKASGRYEFSWDGRDAFGKPLPSGLYFLRPEGSPNLFKFIMLR